MRVRFVLCDYGTVERRSLRGRDVLGDCRLHSLRFVHGGLLLCCWVLQLPSVLPCWYLRLWLLCLCTLSHGYLFHNRGRCNSICVRKLYRRHLLRSDGGDAAIRVCVLFAWPVLQRGRHVFRHRLFAWNLLPWRFFFSDAVSRRELLCRLVDVGSHRLRRRDLLSINRPDQWRFLYIWRLLPTNRVVGAGCVRTGFHLSDDGCYCSCGLFYKLLLSCAEHDEHGFLPCKQLLPFFWFISFHRVSCRVLLCEHWDVVDDCMSHGFVLQCHWSDGLPALSGWKLLLCYRDV